MKFKYLVGFIVVIGLGYWGFSSVCFGCDELNSDYVDEHHDGDGDDEVEEYEIYPGDVVDKIKNGEDIILLDVRTLEEHVELHIENSYLLPVQELSQMSLDEIGLGDIAKDKEIVIYCRSGARSKTAYDIMTSLGYTNVKSSAGGMIHWEEDDYPYTEVGEYIQPLTDIHSFEDVMGPAISLDITEFDLGEITQFGGVVDVPVILSNTGVGDLIIGDITTSCSCTSATVEDVVIGEGEEVLMIVSFDPDFHEEPFGVFKRTVFIPSNDTKTPEVEFTILVDILEGE